VTRRRLLAAAAVTLTVLAVAGLGAGVRLYQHLNANILAMPLSNGATGSAGTEQVDAFGHAPINVLVIGSDGRTSATDCRLGGACGNGGNPEDAAKADVEMLVHISADRSNATVMSIPRDIVTRIPACRDPQTGAWAPGYYGMINSALAHGPGCQVAAAHELTGIPIDHFVMVDFAGVVAMSDAVGGANVCVSDNVYDSYSHLKLAKGTHTLEGLAALEFLRTRHAFGDGSDLGRSYAQHVYLSSMVRTLKSLGTLANPARLYSVADAATNALTVDTGLGGVSRLMGLAADVNKVPTDRIAFATMQTSPDPGNPDRLVVAGEAHRLFETIIKDRPLTPATTPRPSAPPTAGAPTPIPARTATSGAHLEAANHSGGCVQVSHEKTVVVDGIPMTPPEAYAYITARGVPDSAP